MKFRRTSLLSTRSRFAHRGGFSFLEIVFAVVLLSLTAATILSAISYVYSRQRAEQQTLGAHEIASRLVLQYLDDKGTMPDPSLPVEYGRDRYRWEMRLDPVTITPAEPAHPRNDSSSSTAAASVERRGLLDKVRQVTILAWLSEESGGSYGPDAAVPNAKITRLMYPMANRNPDSFQHLLESDTGLREFRDELSGSTPNSPSATPQARPGSTSATSRSNSRPAGTPKK